MSTKTLTVTGYANRSVLFVLALCAAVLLVITQAAALVSADDDDSRGVNGTVMSVGSTSMQVAVRSGLKTVFVDADTVIKSGKGEIGLEDVVPGDKVSAQVEALGGQFLASRIQVRGKTTAKRIQHLTGVVIERDEDSLRLASRNGRSIEIELDDIEERPEVAHVVTAVIETDLATGLVKAKQIDRIERIVERLEDSLSKEIDTAKEAVLKRIIDESARQHLDALNQALDQVEAEARDKIQAALTKFRADYAEVAERVGNAPPEESYEGVIAEITSSTLHVSSTVGEGSRTFTITPLTDITVSGIENASTVDLAIGQSVIVSFLPSADGSDTQPAALAIEALPPALPPVIANTIEDLGNDVVEGIITAVEVDETTGSTVVVIKENSSGATVGVEVTEETDITLDGQPGAASDLAPGQHVQVTLEANGVTAGSIVATTNEPSVNEQSFSGVVTGNDPVRRLIVVAPASGNPLRLKVAIDAVITLNGASATLADIQLQDMVIDVSRYIPDELTVTRLAAVRPAQAGSSGGSGSEDAGPTSTPASTPDNNDELASNGDSGPAPFSIRGFLRSFSGDSFVFDGMTLPKSSGITLPEGVTEGSEVNLIFTVEPDGRIVLTGIQAS